jgi:opacity protein-like surface antigen
MGMGMERLRRISVYIFLLGAPLLGQTRLQTGGTFPAARGPAFDASLGYVYLDMAEPSLPRAVLNGVNADGLVRFTPRWGATVDSTFARSGNVRGTGHSDDVLSALVGPVFYPVARRNNGIFVHVLAGATRVDGAVPVNGTYYLSGQQTHFSYAVGGGVEHALSRSFAVRGGADYQRTTFVNASGAMQQENCFRLITGIVYRFGNPWNRKLGNTLL